MAKKTPRGKVTSSGAAYAEARGLSKNQVKGLTNSDIEGLEIVEDNTAQVIAALDTAYVRALEKIGLAAEGYAKKLCPVDTGRLRNSITHTIYGDDLSAYIGTNVEYGPYIELGSSKNKYKGANGGRGYLRPAANDHKDAYRKIVESELKNA